MLLSASSLSPYGVRRGVTSSRRRIGRTTRATEGEAAEEGSRFDEEAIAKLRKAEEEAERLRRELDALRANQEKEAVLAKAGRTLWTGARFDSKDLKRETIVGNSDNDSGNWLSETDVDFLMGERDDDNGMTPEEREIVNRRLIVGGVLSALFVGFSFVPSEKFVLFKPSGSAVDYLVPVIRSQSLLGECRPLVEEAEWDQVRTAIDRIINSPNKLKSNLDSALTFVSSTEKRQEGRLLISSIMEFIQETDYNKYYEDRLNQRQFKGGAEEAKFVEFSSKSLRTAEELLDQFLRLFPSGDVQEAKRRIDAIYQ